MTETDKLIDAEAKQIASELFREQPRISKKKLKKLVFERLQLKYSEADIHRMLLNNFIMGELNLLLPPEQRLH